MDKAQHLGTSGERPRSPPSSPVLVDQKSCTSQNLSPTGSNPCGDPGRLGSRGRPWAPSWRKTTQG